MFLLFEQQHLVSPSQTRHHSHMVVSFAFDFNFCGWKMHSRCIIAAFSEQHSITCFNMMVENKEIIYIHTYIHIFLIKKKKKQVWHWIFILKL